MTLAAAGLSSRVQATDDNASAESATKRPLRSMRRNMTAHAASGKRDQTFSAGVVAQDRPVRILHRGLVFSGVSSGVRQRSLSGSRGLGQERLDERGRL